MRLDLKRMQAEIYNVVSQIPRGRVLTYGDIAALVYARGYSRFVGRALAVAPQSMGLPCHRVVNASGRLAPAWPGQAELLRAEGVEVREAKGGPRVYLQRYRWREAQDFGQK